ncbi:MAG: undecaprenyl phosphate translocase family protein, partial [Salinigranum sp.]
AIAVSAMILPGISGSLLLIILGQYEHMVETLGTFVDRLLALASGGSIHGVFGPGATVVAFLVGAVVGLFTVSHVVRRALELRREATMAFLVSLIVGALRAPVVKVGEKLAATGAGWTADVLVTFAVAAALGAVLVVVLDRVAGISEGDAGVVGTDPEP